MKISIIVPIYNVDKYLQQCIDSLINQTLEDIQIILVNDGSTDNSLSICNQNALIDNRIVVVNKKNGGLSDARNAGLKNVTGKYVMFLDSDDWIDLETCEQAYEIIEQHCADMVFWSSSKEFEEKTVPEKAIFDTDTLLINEQLEFLQRRVCGLLNSELSEPTKTDLVSSAWGKLYLTKIIIDNNIIFRDTSEVGSEDTLFNFYVFQKIKKAYFINKKFNHYRQTNENSLTKNHKSSLMPRFLNLFELMSDYIEKNNLQNSYREALNNRIVMSTIGINLSIVSPKNSISFFQKINDIDKVLKNPIYINSYKNLKIKYLPFHWKIFFMACRYKFKYIVYLMSVLMVRLRNV